MKKSYFILAVLLLLILTACSSSASEGGDGDYAWVLTERKDYNGPLEYTMDYGSFQFEYKPADYVVDWIYTGETDEKRNVKNGESWSGRCVYSEPPQVINIGDKITLDLSLTETENTLLGAWWVECIMQGYFFYQKGSDSSQSDPYVYFKDDTGIQYFQTNTYEGPSSIKKSITAVAPDGKPGNRIHLTLSFQFDDAGSGTGNISTVYYYELKKQ